MQEETRARIDAKTFQHPLEQLAETMAQKVKREGPGLLPAPTYISEDIYMMMRQSLAIYRVLMYLNADERRESDCYWRIEYGVVTAPIVRSMIDCLYNVTAILEDPAVTGLAYHKSGLKKMLQDVEADEQKYGGKPEWDVYNKERRETLGRLIRMNNLTEEEVLAVQPWRTLGQFILGPETPLKRFLKTFTYSQWRQYSGFSHGAFEGMLFGEIPAGAYFTLDSFPHEERPMIEAKYIDFMTRHLGRAAVVLLCLVTELQAYFRFDGANINERIRNVWSALSGLFEADELYNERYCQLMKERGIAPMQ
jgi:hypothetical protein